MENVYTKSGALARRIYFGATLIFESLYALFRTRVLNDGGTFLEIDLPYTIDSEILLVTPNAFKVGKLYSAKPTNGTGDFTVDRNSTATYVGQDGLIKTALANVPRIDWGTGVPVILRELQRTNLLAYSEDFTKSYWNKTDITITPNTHIAPNGSLTASTFDVISIKESIRQNTPTTVIGNTVYTFSFYVKNIDIAGVSLSVYDASNVGNIVAPTSYFSQINTSEWVRITRTFTTPVNCTSIWVYTLRDSGFIGSINFWGIQLEQGTEASSYIPTNGTTVTRLEDDISVPTPAGVTSITETIDGVEQTPITTIPATYSLPVGNINKVTML